MPSFSKRAISEALQKVGEGIKKTTQTISEGLKSPAIKSALGSLGGAMLAQVAGKVPPLTFLPEEIITTPILTRIGGIIGGLSAPGKGRTETGQAPTAYTATFSTPPTVPAIATPITTTKPQPSTTEVQRKEVPRRVVETKEKLTPIPTLKPPIITPAPAPTPTMTPPTPKISTRGEIAPPPPILGGLTAPTPSSLPPSPTEPETIGRPAIRPENIAKYEAMIRALQALMAGGQIPMPTLGAEPFGPAGSLERALRRLREREII